MGKQNWENYFYRLQRPEDIIRGPDFSLYLAKQVFSAVNSAGFFVAIITSLNLIAFFTDFITISYLQIPLLVMT